MNDRIINGYLLVSAPLGYRGVDRDPWSIIDAGFYERRLPREIDRIYRSIQATEKRGFWWPTTSSLSEAETLLEFTRLQEPSAELIGVYSPYLERVMGRTSWVESTGTFLGIDVIAIGEWSLLRALHSAEDARLHELVGTVNESGLLQQAEDAKRVEDLYRSLAKQGRVEAIAAPDSGLSVEWVAVYVAANTP